MHLNLFKDVHEECIDLWQQSDGEDDRETQQEGCGTTPITACYKHSNNTVYEGFYNFSKVCLQFFSFLNVVFSPFIL